MFKIKTTCGADDYRKDEDDGLKHCNYCGSLQPEELAELIKQGKATMHGSDWKYGYPHKFYVTVPNPKAGEQELQGSMTKFNADGTTYDEPIVGIAPATKTVKFYTNHLELLDMETFAQVAPIIGYASGISFSFEMNNGKQQLTMRAPHFGYQKD